MDKPYWSVVVGNIGTVFVGQNGKLAREVWASYTNASKKGIGRGAGEPVTLFCEEEIHTEYCPGG